MVIIIIISSSSSSIRIGTPDLSKHLVVWCL